MRRSLLVLLMLLPLVRPGVALARPRALGVPGVATAGQELVLRWGRLPGSVREVELELSLEGSRWVRISPELAAAEGRYVWRVPEVASATARVRLRVGGEGFEHALAPSREFRIEAPGMVNRVTPGADWWNLGAPTGAPGRRVAAEARWLDGCVAEQAEPEPDAGVSVPAPGRLGPRIGERPRPTAVASQGSRVDLAPRVALRI